MKTVLYVDDNKEMIELVNIVLANSGYRIISLANGRETLDYCANENPDLVLMDLKMPDMNGFETTQKLRERGYSNPIVVFTASETDEDRERAMAAGCNGYVVKDLEMRGLEGVIDSFIAESGSGDI